MSTRRKRARKRQPAPPKRTTPTTESPAAPSRQKSSALRSADGALDECIGAVSLVEVTMRSLESQEIATPEQEVLKRALKAIWTVHDWIYKLRPDDLDGEDTDREDEP